MLRQHYSYNHHKVYFFFFRFLGQRLSQSSIPFQYSVQCLETPLVIMFSFLIHINYDIVEVLYWSSVLTFLEGDYSYLKTQSIYV